MGGGKNYMSLQVWLPLNKDLRQKGLGDVTITNNGATYDNSVGCPMGGSYNITNGPIEISNLPNPTNISIAFWFKRTANTGTRQFMFTAWNGVTCELTTAGNPTWAVYRSGYPTVTGGTAITTTSGWTHYCGTFSTTEGLKMYINGELAGSNNVTTPIAWNTTTGQIGKYSTYASMSTLMSDFRIYDNALTADEVRALSRGLAVHYPLTRQGFANENLFKYSAMDPDEFGELVFASLTEDWMSYLRTYNGTFDMHSFADGVDTITLNSTGNLGIAFVRKATDISLDSNSYYTISCEAKSSQTAQPLCIGLSYYNNSNTWIWRGGTNPQNFTAANTWQKFTLKFKPDADTQYICYCFTVYSASASSNTFSIRNCKLEKGETATAWMPNSSDKLGVVMGLNTNSVEDISGFDWHGTKINNLQWVGDSLVYPMCADFNTNEGCAMLDPPDYQGNVNLTLAAWVYPKARNSDRDCILIYRGQYLTIDSSGHLSAYAYGKSPAGYHTSTGTIPLNQWSHIAITWDASNVKLYINGTLDKTVSCTGTFAYSSTTPKTIGCIGVEKHPDLSATGLSRQFIGSIADVRVYCTALSAADMTKLYNNRIYLNNIGNIGASGECTHTNYGTVNLDYCLGSNVFDCAPGDCIETQTYRICRDCGKVYVYAPNGPTQEMACGDCDEPADWAPYINKWLPASTFNGLTTRTEYTNIYHG